MGGILLAIVLGLAVVAGLGTVIAAKDAGVKGIGGIVVLLGIALWTGSSINYVGPTDVGVKISAGHIAPESMKSGVHWNAPWTSVETLPKRPLTTNDVTIKARTSEGGSVSVRSAARWHTDEDHAASLYLQVRTGDEDKISDAVVDKFLGQTIGNVYTQYTNADALSKRTGAEADLNTALQAALKPYGIIVDSVFVREVEPDDKTAAFVSRLTGQQNETKIAQESVSTAEQQALAKVAAAKGIKDAADQLPQNLTPLQVQALCIQAWTDAVNKAIAAGKDVYTQPCGGTSATVTTSK